MDIELESAYPQFNLRTTKWLLAKPNSSNIESFIDGLSSSVLIFGHQKVQSYYVWDVICVRLFASIVDSSIKAFYVTYRL